MALLFLIESPEIKYCMSTYAIRGTVWANTFLAYGCVDEALKDDEQEY